jgi:hypothetical protein
MPSRLIKKMRPFAVSEPMISEGPSLPVTRLSATDPLLGCHLHGPFVVVAIFVSRDHQAALDSSLPDA